MTAAAIAEDVVPRIWPEWMSQRTAAAYLDMSPRTFRDRVTVEAIPVGPLHVKRPMKRYRRRDLDAWAARNLLPRDRGASQEATR